MSTRDSGALSTRASSTASVSSSIQCASSIARQRGASRARRVTRYFAASSVRRRRWPASRACPARVVDGQVEERQDRRQEPRRLLRGQGLREPRPGRRRIVARGDGERGTEQLDDGQVRRALAVRRRARAQHDPLAQMVRAQQLPHQARLADAGLADDAHDLTLAPRGRARPRERARPFPARGPRTGSGRGPGRSRAASGRPSAP